MATLPGNDASVRRLVVRTTDFDEAHRAMERVFLPMAMWAMESQTALDMRIDSTQVDEMMTSTVRFGRDIGLRTVEAGSYHVAAPVSGVAESQIGLLEAIQTTQECAAIFPVERPVHIRWRGDCTQMCLDFPRGSAGTATRAAPGSAAERTPHLRSGDGSHYSERSWLVADAAAGQQGSAPRAGTPRPPSRREEY